MAYQTATLPPNATATLIADFISWAVAQAGFTLGNTWTFTGGYTARSIYRDGQYVNLAWLTTNPNKLFLNTSSNHPSSGTLTAQTNCYTSNFEIHLGTSPVRYWMFADGYSAHCAVEWTGGAFQHINVGILEKLGTYTGGVYVSGSYWKTTEYALDGTSQRHSRPFEPLAPQQAWALVGHVRCQYTPPGGSLLHVHALAPTTGYFGGFAINLGAGTLTGTDVPRRPLGRSPSSYNGRTVICPTILAIAETDVGSPDSYIPIGQVKNTGHCNIANLDPGATVNTDWMVFPWSAKNAGGTSFVNSLNYGIAYKK